MSPKVLLCKQCGRMFQSQGTEYCAECSDKIEHDFDAVKKYIYEHEDANITEIVEETGVPEKLVLKFLKEGRLSIDNAGEMIKCEECGRAISSGRYCVSCRNKLASALNSAYVAPKEKLNPVSGGQGKMHIRMRER